MVTNDIEGARPKDLSVLKGRRHRDFFSDYNELNEVYNKIQDQKLNDLLNYQNLLQVMGALHSNLGEAIHRSTK